MIDNARAGEALAARWGYAARPGAVELRRRYDCIRAAVAVNGPPILELLLRDPVPLRAQDVYFVANMNLAHSPRGLRLVQVDPDWEIERAERGTPALERFDSGTWRCEGVVPTRPVSAVFTAGAMTLPRLRYACRPDVLAFHGTERVDA